MSVCPPGRAPKLGRRGFLLSGAAALVAGGLPDAGQAGPTRLRARGVGAVGFAVTLGALTRAGVQWQPVTGTAIAAQLASGGGATTHFAYAGGYIGPSAAGQSAQMNGGPYTVVMNDGQAFVVTIEADCYDVRTQADYDAAAALISAPNGRTIALAAGSTIDLKVRDSLGAGGFFRRVDFSATPMVFKSRSRTIPATLGGLVDSFTAGLEFYDLTVPLSAATSTFTLSTNGALGRKADRWKIVRCRGIGAIADPNDTLIAGNLTQSLGTGDGVTTTFSAASLPYLPLAYANQMSGNTPPNPSPAVITAGAVTATAQANTGTVGAPTVTFSGAGVASGSINLTTGAVTITFSSPPANGAPVSLAYKVLGQTMFYLRGGGQEFIKTSEGGSPLLYVTDLEITDCETLYAKSLCNVTPYASKISGNKVGGFYTIGIKLNSPPDANSSHIINDNVTYLPMCLGTDNGNPHGDHFIFSHTPTLAFDSTTQMYRHRGYNGGSRGMPAGCAWRDLNVSAAGSAIVDIQDMLMVGFPVTEAISIENPKDCTIRRCTLAGRNNGADANTASLWMGGTRRGTNLIVDCIAEAYNYAAFASTTGPVPTQTNCLTLGKAGVTRSYASTFVGPTYDSVAPGYSLATLMAQFTAVGGVSQGANMAAFGPSPGRP